jgi:hypothetical protein
MQFAGRRNERKYLMSKTRNRLICGMPEEWSDFEKRHSLFLERFPRLDSAFQTTFIREVTLSEPIDKFVFQYGRLCLEDFFEIVLCCGNGYGMAAQKLLRTLYERAVTLAYLNDHPSELDSFIDFQKIQDYKVVRQIEESSGQGTIPAQIVEEVKAGYDEVKDRFMVTDCKTCGTKRLNHFWNKSDFVTLSKTTGSKADGRLGALIVHGYYFPLKHAHATFGALTSRLEVAEDDSISFVPTAQRKPADEAFKVAHNVILQVLLIHNERFKVATLEEKLQICTEDFIEIWDKKKTNTPNADERS